MVALEEVASVMLKYRCPNNRQEVETSIETDEVVLLEMRSLKLSLWCPYCTSSHQVKASEAYVK
jgi:transposase-like protein